MNRDLARLAQQPILVAGGILVLVSLLFSAINSSPLQLSLPTYDEQHLLLIIDALHEVSANLQQIQKIIYHRRWYDEHGVKLDNQQVLEPDSGSRSTPPSKDQDKSTLPLSFLSFMLACACLQSCHFFSQTFKDIPSVKLKRRMIGCGIAATNAGLMVMSIFWNNLVWHQYVAGAISSCYVGAFYAVYVEQELE